MEKHFTLLVPKGTTLHSKNGVRTLDGIPEDAIELWEKGATFLTLNKENTDFLTDWEKPRLQKALALKKRQKMDNDVAILEKIIKSQSAVSSKPKTEK